MPILAFNKVFLAPEPISSNYNPIVMKLISTLGLIGLFLATFHCAQAQDGAWPGLGVGTINCSSSVTQTGSTYSAANNCGARGSRDHIYNFTITQAGSVTVSLCATNGFNNYLYIFDATGTPCSGWLTRDNDGCPGTTSALISNFALTAGSYVVVIEGRYNGSRGSYQMDIDFTCPPTNDTPCNATTLTVGTTASYAAGTNIAATSDSGIPSPSCGNYQNSDVWYTATVPANGLLVIDTQTGSMTDAGLAAYTNDGCSGTYELIQCDDDDSENSAYMPAMYFSNLPPGTVVYLRVWGYGNSNQGTFNIAAWSPSGDCAYILDLRDSYGDGWDGSTVGISINGGTPVTHTVNGFQHIIPIGVNSGDLIQLYYTSGGGGSENQISYFLALMNGVVFADGPAPGNGLKYTGAVDCITPASSPEDCIGGITICSDGTFNGNTNHTGLNEDLNSSNQGCLSLGERQGTWYHFSPSQGGTIEMTISPQNSGDDYDFAIWGPLNGLDCSPSGPPLRCSYAAPGGDTGMQNGSGHNSENSWGDKWVNGMNVQVGEVYMMYIDNWTTTANSFDLSWGLTNGASLACNVLPVELTTFRAEQDNSDVRVIWYTATELNNDYFDLERSIDGFAFESITKVDGMGTTQSPTFYEHLDRNPVNGSNYYRLKQVDHNGDYAYSDVVNVNFIATGIGATEPFPNPLTSSVSIDLFSADPAVVTTTIIDVTGRTVMTSETALSGNLRMEINLTEQPNGMYMLNLRDQNGEVISNHVVIKE